MSGSSNQFRPAGAGASPITRSNNVGNYGQYNSVAVIPGLGSPKRVSNTF